MDNRNENLGPAERIIQTILTYNDHVYHGRPGMVLKDPTTAVGVRWIPVTHKMENGEKVVYQLSKVGRKTNRIKVGVCQMNGQIKSPTGTVVGEYRAAGLFPEVAVWLYKQVAEVWKLDNEFAARWASYVYGQEHRDLKVILAAFMLCQSRKGDPVMDNGKIVFYDDDFRDVGEAMMLLQTKDSKNDLNAKLLMRIKELLALPGVAAVNRELGFGKSARNPFFGRWQKAAEKWLAYREENPRLLEGLVKAGFRTTVMDLARNIGYKPDSTKFFEYLRWKQKQAKDGRRVLAIGQEVVKAESWVGLTEKEICERIVSQKIGFKRIVGMIPKEIGMTKAIVAAAIEAGSLSDKDLIIFTPTLEELGMMEIPDIKARWEKALKAADDMRAANIALRVKSTAAKESLNEASDKALQNAVAESMKGIRIYFMVDISGSMEGAIVQAKTYISRFLQAFPMDKIHISVFNTTGRIVELKAPTAKAVEVAMANYKPSGGTDYGSGVRALQHFKPKDDEDVIFIFVGDEEAQPFANAVRASGLNPLAIGFVKVTATTGAAGYRAMQGYAASAVRDTGAELGLPVFMINEATFADPYAIPRTIRNLINSTPVNRNVQRATPVRVTLVDAILKTELLKKPVWAT